MGSLLTTLRPGITGAAPFSPIDIPGLTLWLDAADTSTITESGGAVSQWDDKSGNGYNVVQATAANQPTTGTRTLNGLNVLDFNIDSLATSSSAISSTAQYVFFAVVQSDVGNVANQYLLDTTSGGRNIVAINSSQWLINQGTNLSSGTPDTNAHILRAVFGTTDSLHVDAVSTISGNAGTNAIDSIRLGSNQAVTTVFWNGFIAEVIIVDGTLTAGEISDIEQYLSSKWGITI